MTELIRSFPLVGNFAIFVIAAGCLWIVGTQLIRLSDELSDRFKLAKSIVGLVFLATTTSLPEIATTFSGARLGNAPLVLNNLFGGILLQTAILAVADLWTRGAISNYPRRATHALEATLLVVLLSGVMAIVILDEPYSFGALGYGSIVVGFLYGFSVWLLRKYDINNDWVPVDLPEPSAVISHDRTIYSEQPSSAVRLLLRAGLMATLVFILGYVLVIVAESLADQTGMGSSFIGVTLLATATSLPELATTIAAVRAGAFTLAISNVFGSNLIMLGLVLPADVLYSPGPILRSTTDSVLLALAMGVLVTAIYLVGLIVRRKPRLGSLGADSVLVLFAYFLGLYLFYLVK